MIREQVQALAIAPGVPREHLRSLEPEVNDAIERTLAAVRAIEAGHGLPCELRPSEIELAPEAAREREERAIVGGPRRRHDLLDAIGQHAMARGALIDEEAMIAALKAGKIVISDRFADSTMAIMRSTKVSPGLTATRTTISLPFGSSGST